jgi:hypothetical protein
MALEKELETYKKHLAALKDKEGKFALIHGDDVVGTFSAYDDAVKEGYTKFGLESFLVKKINATEHVQFISRFAAPCSAPR